MIADNCTDQTAAGGNAGARVVERFDDVRQSKGYALNDQIDRLETGGELSAWDAVVIVDADTTVSRDLLRAFDSDLRRGIDWIQAYYTVANPDTSWRTRLITYAFSLFNGVMPLGKARLGVSSALNGNGMCFSVRGLRKVPWQSRGLVEDMEYAWEVRLAGGKIAFQPDVSIQAEMLSSGGRASENQRKPGNSAAGRSEPPTLVLSCAPGASACGPSSSRSASSPCRRWPCSRSSMSSWLRSMARSFWRRSIRRSPSLDASWSPARRS